jgi:hypothetical protein
VGGWEFMSPPSRTQMALLVLMVLAYGVKPLNSTKRL